MTLIETISYYKWAAHNCEGEVRDECLQMVEWLEELVKLRRMYISDGITIRRDPFTDKVMVSDGSSGFSIPSWGVDILTNGLRRKANGLKAENAKLRELVADMWRDVPKTESCGWDADANCCTGSDECAGECGYWYRMRELGIEVDE